MNSILYLTACARKLRKENIEQGAATSDGETTLDEQRETSGVFYSKRGAVATQADYADEWWVGAKVLGDDKAPPS